MTAAELIAELSKLPPDAKVWHLWDGELRTEINFVWLSKGGDVVTADYDQVAYSDDARPIDAPNIEHWETPERPE